MPTQPALFEAPTRRYRGYIFDCDGTLADSMPVHHQAWQTALRACGVDIPFDWQLFVSRAGMSLEATATALGEQFQVRLDPVELARLQREAYGRLESTVQPIHEVVNFARTAAEHGRVSIASGNRRDQVERILVTLSLRELFEVIVTPEDVTHGKPAPDMFLLAAEKMGIAPEECVVFEDSPLGIQAAQAANMAAVFVDSARAR